MLLFILSSPIVLIVLYFLYKLYEIIFPAPAIQADGRVVIITGCDSGFGFDVTLALKKKNFHVVATCLTDDGIKRLSDACSCISSGALTAVKSDITQQNDIDKLEREVLSSFSSRGIYCLVNNAGILRGFLVDCTTMQEYRDVMEVNFFGHVAMTKAFFPLIAKSKGRIVNVASVAGVVAPPNMSAYASSKFAFEAFSDCCRREFLPFGVDVSIIEPGFMKTNILLNLPKLESLYNSLPPAKQERWGLSLFREYDRRVAGIQSRSENPALVLDDIMHAITSTKPKQRYKSGLFAKTAVLLVIYLPTWLQDLCLNLVAPIPVPAAVAAASSARSKQS